MSTGRTHAEPTRSADMVFYFEARGGYVIYMGKNKYENELLIKYGWVRSFRSCALHRPALQT